LLPLVQFLVSLTLNSSKARLPPIPGAIPSRTRAGVAGRGFAQKSGSLLWVTGKSRLPEFLFVHVTNDPLARAKITHRGF
jgi:hypothetical protein